MSDMTEQQAQQEHDAASPWAAEEKRLKDIRAKRREKGECILCGKALGFFDKFAKRDQHNGCDKFTE